MFLTACSEKLPTLFNSDKIVAFGDSLTYGYNVAPEHSYPEQLKKMTGYRIINEGLSGDTATLGKKRLQDADVYKKVANKENVFLLDNIFSKYLSDDSLKIDLVHLNEKGYKLVAQDIAKRLKKAGLFM